MNVKRDPFLHIEAPPDRVVTAPLTDQSLRVSGRLEPSSIPIIPNLRLSFHVDAANPLEPFAPPINCELDVLLTATGTQLFSFSVIGSHDAFPAYELYIEQRLVYSYDPVVQRRRSRRGAAGGRLTPGLSHRGYRPLHGRRPRRTPAPARSQ